MRSAIMLFLLTIGLCSGVTCSVGFPGDGDADADGIIIGGTTRTTLDRADASITVADNVDQGSATVTARIVDSRGRVVRLRSDQAVRVNGTALTGPRTNGDYQAIVAAAGVYTIEVQEPTRGIEQTTASNAADFDITSPIEGAGVSLLGFVLEWSAGDSRTQVEIVLRQIVFGAQTRRVLGPFADNGQRALSAEDLRDFVQGAPLEIIVAKLVEGPVAGFRDGTYSIRREATRAVDPRP